MISTSRRWCTRRDLGLSDGGDSSGRYLSGAFESWNGAGYAGCNFTERDDGGAKAHCGHSGDLPEQVKRQGIETPAIIVVGKVCELAKRFSWYEELPLAGWKVLVTRPKDLISAMSEKLRRKGAEVLELPAIETRPYEDQSRLKRALGELDVYGWVVFTSRQE